MVGQYHVPPYDSVTVHFMREVLAGRKKLLTLKELVPVNVPRITEFQADRIYENAIRNSVSRDYLPDPPVDSTRRPCGRKFLFDVSDAVCYVLCQCR